MAICYDDLERVLLDVGFVAGHVDGVHQTYVHGRTGLTFSLPMLSRPQRGLPTYVTALRAYLQWSGLMEPDAFDDRVRQATPVRGRRSKRPRQVAGSTS